MEFASIVEFSIAVACVHYEDTVGFSSRGNSISGCCGLLLSVSEEEWNSIRWEVADQEISERQTEMQVLRGHCVARPAADVARDLSPAILPAGAGSFPGASSGDALMRLLCSDVATVPSCTLPRTGKTESPSL